MRDAFGSTFMFKLIIIFIVFYVSFMTIAVSYAKVFRIKNQVIDILEQKQFDYRSDSDWSSIVNGDIDTLLDESVYRYTDNAQISENCNSQNGKLSKNGVCITSTKLGTDSAYYTVTVYLVVKFPVFNYSAVIPVYGETELVDLY